jgi:hypothetical protein
MVQEIIIEGLGSIVKLRSHLQSHVIVARSGVGKTLGKNNGEERLFLVFLLLCLFLFFSLFLSRASKESQRNYGKA